MTAARLILRPPRPVSVRTGYLAVSLAAHAAVFAAIALWPGFRGSAAPPADAMVVDLVGSLAPPARPSASAAQAVPEAPAAPEPRPSAPPPKREEAVRVEPEPAPRKERERTPESKPEPRPTPEPAEPAAASGPGDLPGVSGDAPPASGGTGAADVQSLDLGSLEHAWYRDAVSAALRSRWIRPVLEGLHEPREVEVAFEILADGQVRNVRLERSSGVPSLDRSALRAVVEASPLPPPPRSLGSGPIPARFLFRWRPGRS